MWSDVDSKQCTPSSDASDLRCKRCIEKGWLKCIMEFAPPRNPAPNEAIQAAFRNQHHAHQLPNDGSSNTLPDQPGFREEYQQTRSSRKSRDSPGNVGKTMLYQRAPTPDTNLYSSSAEVLPHTTHYYPQRTQLPAQPMSILAQEPQYFGCTCNEQAYLSGFNWECDTPRFANMVEPDVCAAHDDPSMQCEGRLYVTDDNAQGHLRRTKNGRRHDRSHHP